MRQRTARAAQAVALGLLFACAIGSAPHKHASNKPSPRFAKQDRINFAIDLEGLMTADPALGLAPRERLLDARREAAELRLAAENSRNPLTEIVWEERGPSNIGGRTRALLVDANDPTGNTLWAGSVGGGLWKTTDALAASPVWEKVDDALDNLAVACIAQSKSEPGTLFFGTGEGYFNNDAVRGLGIWRSKNGGATWQRLASTVGPEFFFTQKIVCASGQTVLAATRAGIYRSTDFGQTWAKVLGKNTAACPTDRAADLVLSKDGTLFAAMGIFEKGGIWRSTDGGKNWAQLTTGLPAENLQRIKLACAPSDPDRLYAMMSNGTNYDCLGIWRSDDAGDTWQPMSLPNPLGMSNLCRGMAWYCMAAAVDPNDRDRLLAGGIDLFETKDGGQNWQPISQWHGGFGQPFVHADQHEVVFKPGSSQTFFVGNDGGVFRGKSTAGAGGKPAFEFIGDGYNVTQYYGCAISPEAGSPLALAGAQDNGSQLFGQNSAQNPLDTGKISSKPAQTVTGGDGGYCHFDRDQPGVQVTSYVFSTVNITADNWATYEQVTVGQGGEGLFVNPSVYDDSTNTLFMAFEFNSLGIIEDVGGANLPKIAPVFLQNSYITSLTLLPGQPGSLLVGLSNGDLARIDDARSAKPKATILRDGTGWPSCIAVEPGRPQHWLLTYSNYGVASVFETKNAGADWQPVEGNLPDMPVRWAVFAPNDGEKALLATELGVWATGQLDGPSTEWLPANGSMANVRTDMIATRPADGRVIAATHGRGLFETRFFSGENGCAKPVDLAVSLLTDSSATVGWWAHSQPDSFEILFRKTGATDWESTVCKDSFLKIDSLQPATGYEWRVRSFCENGPSVWSASQVFLTKSPVPLAAPTGLKAELIDESSALLGWEKTPGATGFDLRWRQKGTANWLAPPLFSSENFFLEQLEPAHHYEFSVRSRGKYGPSDWAGGFVFTTAGAGSGCPPPNGVRTFELRPHSAKIGWTGSPGAAGFSIRYKKEGGGNWKSIDVAEPTSGLAAGGGLTDPTGGLAAQRDRQAGLSGLSAGRAYFFQIKTACGGSEGSVWSELGRFELPPELGCQPVADADDEWIESIQLAGFQQVTGRNGGYFYHADEPILLERNRGHALEIRPGFSGMAFSENYAAWLDLNQNGEFEHPAELVFSRETTKDSLVAGQIFIPENVPTGLAHLRVMMRFSPIGAACGNIAWGEVEDYLVKIVEVGGPGFSGGGAPAGPGLIDLGDGLAASVFPNPVRDHLTVSVPVGGFASLFDAVGRRLAEWPLDIGENGFDTQFLPKGIYSLVIVGGRLPVAVRLFKG